LCREAVVEFFNVGPHGVKLLADLLLPLLQTFLSLFQTDLGLLEGYNRGAEFLLALLEGGHIGAEFLLALLEGGYIAAEFLLTLLEGGHIGAEFLLPLLEGGHIGAEFLLALAEFLLSLAKLF
jgi:hypothetical protein